MGRDGTGFCSVCLNRPHLRLENFRYCHITSLAELIPVVKYWVLTWGMGGKYYVPTCLGLTVVTAQRQVIYTNSFNSNKSNCGAMVRISGARVINNSLRAIIAMAEIWERTKNIFGKEFYNNWEVQLLYSFFNSKMNSWLGFPRRCLC